MFVNCTSEYIPDYKIIADLLNCELTELQLNIFEESGKAPLYSSTNNRLSIITKKHKCDCQLFSNYSINDVIKIIEIMISNINTVINDFNLIKQCPTIIKEVYNILFRNHKQTDVYKQAETRFNNNKN